MPPPEPHKIFVDSIDRLDSRTPWRPPMVRSFVRSLVLRTMIRELIVFQGGNHQPPQHYYSQQIHKNCPIKSPKKDGWMDGWMDGWIERAHGREKMVSGGGHSIRRGLDFDGWRGSLQAEDSQTKTRSTRLPPTRFDPWLLGLWSIPLSLSLYRRFHFPPRSFAGLIKQQAFCVCEGRN